MAGPLFVLRRLVAVARAFAPFALAYARDRRRFLLFGGARTVDAATRERRARRLHETLLALGPTFIKLGQLLSTRPDVLPGAYVDELSELQDRVPPAEWDAAREVLEAELGPVEEAFESFDTEPISGASLGQVYTARFQGERVAVKVRRPGVESLVEADLRVVYAVLPLLLRVAPPGQRFTLSNLADEFSKTIREEMDYVHEREALETIRANFADDPSVVVPASIAERSGARVLTMEYVAGTKISDVDALDRKEIDRSALAESVERAYVEMLIEDGVFHADPHPGNLAVRDDGAVVLYDFGMTGSLGAERREQLRAFYVAVTEDDADALVDAFVEMGAVDPTADRAFVRDVMTAAVDHLRGDDLSEERITALVEGFEETLHDVPFRMPQDLAFVVRVATVLEGVCVTLDPEFDFVAVVEEYIAESDVGPPSADERVEYALAEGGDALARNARAAVRIPPKLDRALDRVDRDDLRVRATVLDERSVLDSLARRLALGVAASAGVVASAVLYTADQYALTAGVALGTAGCLAFLYRSFGASGRQRAIREAGQVAQRSLQNRGQR